MEPGFYKDLPADDYHSGEGISKSDLWAIQRSPAHWKYQKKKETPGMMFGSAFHAAALEPEIYKAKYVTMPSGLTMRHNAGKDFAANAAANGQCVITAEDRNVIAEMIEALQKHHDAKDLIWPTDGNAEYELSSYWQDPEYGILCKSRHDVLNKSIGASVDIKTTVDARPRPFGKIAWDKGYYAQAGFYTYGLLMLTKVRHDFYFVAIEKESPYGINVYRATQEYIDEGLKVIYQAIKIYIECHKDNRWPCYPEGLLEIDLPSYVKRKEMLNAIIE